MSRTTKRPPQARRTPTRRPRVRRLRLWWAVSAAVAVAGAAGLLAVALRPGGPKPPAATAIVATVNGQAIPVREFDIFLAQERAATFAHFQQTYGTADGPTFWTTPHDGTTPTAYLTNLALADATRTTVVQQLAHRYALLPDPSYNSFLGAWTAENDRRAAALTAGRPIYGPTRYTEANYLTYIVGNLAYALETKLAADTTDAELRSYYATHHNELRQGAYQGAPTSTPPYAQARDQIRQLYVDERYQALVAQLVSTARVRTAPTVLDAVPLS